MQEAAMLQLIIAFAILNTAVCDTFYIIPNAGDATSCPASAGMCHTLHDYASNPMLASNLILELQPGNHSLNTTLSLTSSVVNFTMVSSGSSTIICGRSPNRGFITFEQVQTVNIVGQLYFVDCYTRVRTANNLTVQSNVYQGGDSVGFQVNSVSYAHFQQTSFISVRGSAMDITDSTVTVESCNFIGNGHTLRHGGAIVTQSRTLTVINSIFTDNFAGVEGGGIYSMSSRVYIRDCNFTRNAAGQLGGAVSIKGSGGSIWYSNFIENTAGEVIAGSGTGGAVLNQNVFDSTALEVHYSSFASNAAGGSGGGIFIRSRRPFDVTNSIFRNNSAYQGGAIDLYAVDLSVTNCTFSDNSAVLRSSNSNPSPRGGAIQIRGGIRCVRSNFTNNSAEYYGGVAYMYDDPNDFYTEQCIFTNNSATTGSGGVLYGAGRETKALIVDSIFTRNSAPHCGIADMLTVTDSYHNNFTSVSSLFTHNSATDNTSDVGGFGGVGCVKTGSIIVICSTFTDNIAAQNASVFHANESAVTISQSLFSRNSAEDNGGVMYTSQSSHSISDTVFNSNSVQNGGGALFISEASGQSTVHNCQFRQNSAGEGGALFVDSSPLTVTQTNFLSNAATTTSGVASSCNSQVSIDGATNNLQTTTISMCTLFSGDISNFNVSITFDCPFGEPNDPSVIILPEGISLPIVYDVLTIGQGVGLEGTCPIEQLRQQTRENAKDSIREIVKNYVAPLLQSDEPRNR